jgi:Family of unknown function (DUF6800)
MTTPSRRHEILKQRARKRKITILRRRFKSAGTEAERGQILGKLARLSPTMTLEQFTREKQASS